MKPSPRAEPQHIAKLVEDLNSTQFKMRDAARRELEKLGDVAEPALQKALAGKVTLELKQRVEALLVKLEGANLAPETLRQVRTVEALEYIGTPEARQLLETLTEGAADARQTREARAALDRIANRHAVSKE